MKKLSALLARLGISFWFGLDLKSTYKSLWIGPMLITWCNDIITERPTDFHVSFNPD